MYEAALDENLQCLHRRLHAGAYRALPSRRVYIPKADGKQRPLGIAAMEDKIVQEATVMILTPISSWRKPFTQQQDSSVAAGQLQ
jgi:RNA-directed DNA polymerase